MAGQEKIEASRAGDYQPGLGGEQYDVQIGMSKYRKRLLTDYDDYFFRYVLDGGKWVYSGANQVINEALGKPVMCWQDMLFALAKKSGVNRAFWVEMGGGLGLAMRQVGLNEQLRAQIDLLNVDIINPDYDLPLIRKAVGDLKFRFPGFEDDCLAVPRMWADCQTAELPREANLISSIENIQYLSDPLGAIANWYNQLAVDGLLLIGSYSRWPSRILMDGGEVENNSLVVPILVSKLNEHGIKNGIKRGSDDFEKSDDDISLLVLAKKPGTIIRVNMPVTKVEVNGRGYKSVVYGQPSEGERVEVLFNADGDISRR